MNAPRHLHLVKTVWAPGTPAPVAGSPLAAGTVLVPSAVPGTTVVPGRNGIKYGAKYAEDRDVAEIAKLVRADIKAAVAAGELPAAKYGVRISRFSMGRSLTVTVDELPFPVCNPERVRHDHLEPHAWRAAPLPLLRTEAANAAMDKVEAIVDAYNFDGSDPMTDYSHVNFYGHVNFGSQYDREWEELNAKFKAEKLEALRPEREANLAKWEAVTAKNEKRAACPAAWTHELGSGCGLCE